MDLIGLHPPQFRTLVIEPALGFLGLPGGEAAIRLVLATGIQESNLRYLTQAKGPALGLFQIEPATHHDLIENFLAARPELDKKLNLLATGWPALTQQLACNLCYAAAVCRLIYFRAPDPLPAADDVDGMGKYWKRFYNSSAGAGSVAEFVANHRRYLGG